MMLNFVEFRAAALGIFLSRLLFSGKLFKVRRLFSSFIGRKDDEDLNARLQDVGVFRDIINCKFFMAALSGREKGLVLDIGANLGEFGRRVAEETGCVVHFFEPNSSLMEKLTAVSRKIDGRVIRAAVSSKAGTAVFTFKPEHTGGGKIAAAPANSTSAGELVQVISVDDYCRNESLLEELVGIKIDVEGHEADVFVGARASIESRRPVICFEMSNPEKDWEVIRSVLSNYCFYIPLLPGLDYERNIFKRFLLLLRTLLLRTGSLCQVTTPRGYQSGVIAVPCEKASEIQEIFRRNFESPINMLS